MSYDDTLIEEVSEDVDSKFSEPEQITTAQWGLRLPNGEVHWNVWQGVTFYHPIDRLRMVATLRQTAIDVGLAEGEQVEEFVSRYSWETRTQHATVVYEQTGAYSLMHPAVSALSAPDQQVENDHDSKDTDAPSPEQDPLVGVHSRPVGGDAG